MTPPDNTEETSAAGAARPLVLVVDDDDAIRESLKDLLEEAGFDALGARDGLEALRLLAAQPTAPTFILLDLMMPVMDGWAFCDTRRKIAPFRDVPVIAISAAEIAESDRPKGIDAFLAKPIDVDRFALLAARLVGRKRRGAGPGNVLH